jgi:hypothetical protein
MYAPALVFNLEGDGPIDGFEPFTFHDELKTGFSLS